MIVASVIVLLLLLAHNWWRTDCGPIREGPIRHHGRVASVLCIEAFLKLGQHLPIYWLIREVVVLVLLLLLFSQIRLLLLLLGCNLWRQRRRWFSLGLCKQMVVGRMVLLLLVGMDLELRSGGCRSGETALTETRHSTAAVR